MVEVKLGMRSIDLPYTVRISGVTPEMFEELVDEDTRAELIHGVMIVHSPASLRHDHLVSFLGGLMGFYSADRNLGEVFHATAALVQLDVDLRVGPDVFFIPTGQLTGPLPKVYPGVPELVVEVLSPSNRDEDLQEKRPAYRKAGVKELWIVDDENHELLIDRKRRRRYTEETFSSGVARSDVLNGFAIDVSWLWQDPLPNRMTCLRGIIGPG